MWNYIDEEPSALERLLGDPLIQETAAKIKDYENVIFVAHGSSYNAALTTHDFFTRMTGMRTSVHTPGDFMYNDASAFLGEGNLVIAISQTGTSRGVLEAIDLCRKHSIPVLGMTDAMSSPVEQKSLFTLYLRCGEENSNAKTKGYTNTLALIILLAVETGLKRHVIDDVICQTVRNELRNSAAQIPAAKKNVLSVLESSGYGIGMEAEYIIGEGMNFGTAMEAQLKMMETLCIPTSFNETGEFSHGMHRSVSKNVDSIVIDACNPASDRDALKAWQFMKQCGRHSLLVTTDDAVSGEQVIHIAGYPLTQSVILTTLAVQVISVYVPERNGYDPNRASHNEVTALMNTRVSC